MTNVNSLYAYLIPEGKAKAFTEWCQKQDQITAEKQSDKSLPDYGACGGAITYEVTPTSIGLFVKARHNITQNVFELSDTDNF